MESIDEAQTNPEVDQDETAEQGGGEQAPAGGGEQTGSAPQPGGDEGGGDGGGDGGESSGAEDPGQAGAA
jgi:hypothetical protein